MARKILCGGVLAVLGCAVAVGAADLVAPSPVSPGSGQQVETVPGSWPTFSWGAVAGAAGYRLVVYELTAEGELGRAVIRQALAAGASSWSPPLRQGLEPGASYAWTVGAVARKGKMLWSEPALFRVAPGPGERELEEALAVVRRYWVLQGDGAGEVGSKSADPSARQPESRPEAGVSTPHTQAPAGTELSVEGNVDAGSFSGSGALLTALDPANLSPGTAAIDISGTAATASDLVGAACVSESELDFDPATQAEMGAHAALASVHHAATVDTTCHGAACDGTSFTDLQWANLEGLPTTTKGDLLVEGGAGVVGLPVGTAGQVLMVDSGASAGLDWASVDLLRLLPALVAATGQTTSYATGDDGHLRKGVSWPNPRFAVNGDGTVTDNLTGLIWLQDASCADLAGTDANGKGTWTAALSAAAALANGTCGLTDGSAAGTWRLPNRFELESLLDLEFYSPALSDAAGTAKWTADGDAFSGVQSSSYWSSTTYASLSTYAWFVYFGNGLVHNDYKVNLNYVWPVRGGQ